MGNVTPFGRPLTEEDAERIVRNPNLGWDVDTLEQAQDMRRRSLQRAIVAADAEDSGNSGVVMALVILGIAVTFGAIIGAGLMKWWLT
ncbi:MAG: hypothetical protein VYB46_08645 [Pseudomonadota bacterium]|nr:hypothetical protein [Pseudomonadota bacterium]